ncbi:MAG TPA: hypothetical protein VGK62_01815 [Gaiellaceae bacterium]
MANHSSKNRRKPAWFVTGPAKGAASEERQRHDRPKRGALPAAIVVLCVAALTACGSGGRSVLYSGVSLGASGKRTVITDAAAGRDAQRIRKRWLAEISQRAHEARSQRFANLSESQFRRRLNAAANRYHFTVERIQFLRPSQFAPLLVLQTRGYLAVAHAVPAIEKLLDPHHGTSWRGFAFEAFFLEVRDERGVPFIVTNYAVRGRGSYSGMWARADALYPTPHS